MQFHLDGFQAGDPEVHAPAADISAVGGQGPLPDEVDVLIVGCGPAGLTLAAQLAAFPDIRTRIVEQKPGPLSLGQADGVACRTMEMFEAFGFADRILKESYWVNETAFWKPAPGKRERIQRSARIQDTEDGLSEFPHVILNQARVHDCYLDLMRNSPRRMAPDYGWRLSDLTVDAAAAKDSAAYPVTVELERCHDGEAAAQKTVRARYVVGCDGARSSVRKAMGAELKGDSANQAWGVMDVLAVTDFPDIRLKAVIHSANEGNMLIIPREGGYLVRLYIELEKLGENERVAGRDIGTDQLIAAAQRIIAPYSLEVKDIAWWSVYEIGQRLCDRYDDVPAEKAGARAPHVFIAGDACHTHSPKAGQGMNVSMRDTFNLGWKLAAVLRGQASPALLATYSEERQAVAKELIDFDREFARMFSAPPKEAGDAVSEEGVDPAEFQRYFQRQGRFTAGVETRYTPSLITSAAAHQALATGFVPGTRFHSAPVIRLADAKPVELGHCVKADGRWRIFAFSGAEAPMSEGAKIQRLCAWLSEDAASPIRRYTPAGSDLDAVIDLRAIFQQNHRDLDVGALPGLLAPLKGRFALRDYEKAFCVDGREGADIYSLRGVDRRHGCMVIVRPDQHVAHILPLAAHAELAAFFEGFMTTG